MLKVKEIQKEIFPSIMDRAQHQQLITEEERNLILEKLEVSEDLLRVIDARTKESTYPHARLTLKYILTALEIPEGNPCKEIDPFAGIPGQS